MEGKQQSFNPQFPYPHNPQPPEDEQNNYPPQYQPQEDYPAQVGHPQHNYPQEPPPPYYATPYPPIGRCISSTDNPGYYGITPMSGPMLPGPPVPSSQSISCSQHHCNREEMKPYTDETNGHLGFPEQSVRLSFLRKIFSILTVQLMAATGIISLICFQADLKHWTRITPQFLWASYAITIVLLFTIRFCCENIRRQFPANIIFLILLTLLYSVLLGTISVRYNCDVAILGAGTTTIVCLGLFAFTFQRTIDFTGMRGSLLAIVIVLSIFGVLGPLFRHKFPVMMMIYTAIWSLLFSIYLAYQTQTIMMGRRRYANISPSEYIFATQLYWSF